MTKKRQSKKKSKRTTKSEPSSRISHEYEAHGHKISLTLEVTGKRSETMTLPDEKVAQIRKEDIISVTSVPFGEKEFDVKRPAPDVTEGGSEEENAAAVAAWEAVEENAKLIAEWDKAKLEFDADQAEKKVAFEEKVKGYKRVTAWMPVTFVSEAKMDGHQLRIFHTLRGPLLAMVVHDDSMKASVYSPCLLDPNISKGRVHYLPIAFAGRYYTVYRQVCVGESIPQTAEISGYPEFVEHNRKGEYKFRSRSAYHHIDADLPEGAPVASADLTVREPLFGLIPTTDTRETKEVQRARQAKAAQEASTPPASE
jgi:hypothetical protein